MADLVTARALVPLPPPATQLALCPTCRLVLRDDPQVVRRLGAALLVVAGVAHLDVGAHPYSVRTACGRVYARDELA